MRPIAATILKIQMLLDAHPAIEQAQARAFVDARYPGGSNAPVHAGSNEPNAPVQNGSNAPVHAPVQKGGLEGGFLQFWSLYPKKTGKQEAHRIWLKVKPNAELLDKILRAIREQITSDQWNKENGQFIPHPKTWLNQGRWDDEPVQTAGLNHATDVSGLVRFAEKKTDEPERPKAIRGRDV
jgi:hypothetical protein